MAPAVASPEQGPIQKIEAAVIAARPTRTFRARVFQGYVLAAAVLFVALAIAAHFYPYFPIDLTITRAVQGSHGVAFDRLMYGISWLGFMPQSYVIATLAVAMLFLAGLRWEASSTVFAACGVGIGMLIKLIVYRPRPGADLVHVLRELPTAAFPSGHVLGSTAFVGFLVFLGYTLLKKSPGRIAVLAAFGVFIGLMGLSRIYQGEHWFSDVMGAYLLGSLWLALTIKFYRWGKLRFFKHQSAASETPSAPSTSKHPLLSHSSSR